MNKDWEIKKVYEICEIEFGTRVVRKVDGGTIFPVYGGGGATFKMDTYNRENCLIVSRFAMSEKCTRFVEGKFFLNDSGLSLRANENVIYQKYLEIVILGKNDEIYSLGRGAAQKNLDMARFRELKISYPKSLEEQKRIVKILDEKFAQLETIKAASQTNLQNAKDLFQSQLAKAFSNTTWEKAKLEDIALDFSRGKSKHRPRNDKCLFGGDYPFIQTGDIRNADKYVTDYTETYNETGLAQSKLWQKGTLCITIAANIAETAILSFPCCFPDSVIGFIPNEKLTTVDFVYYLIQFFKSELQKMSKGAAQDNLNLAKFENMNFPLPPLPEQKRIVEQLDSLSEKTKALQNIYEQMLLDCEELKQSFLCKAFAGEL